MNWQSFESGQNEIILKNEDTILETGKSRTVETP